jgi:hypothetical protein
MSMKMVFPCALGLALLGVCPIWGQDGPGSSMGDPTHVPAPARDETTRTAGADRLPASLSSWITYTHPDCCGPIGADGPIRGELYLRTGPSFPVEGRVLGHLLDVGWEVAGGGRSLFFNAEMDAAWTVDLGVSNINNQGQHSETTIPISQAGQAPRQVTLRNLNRTYANGWFGREWYPQAPANHCDFNWRVGIDLGGGLGSDRAEFVEISHRTHVCGFAGVALHSDVEIPCGCCTFLGGLRLEWDYNWTNVLQVNNGQVEDLNLLITAGVRF